MISSRVPRFVLLAALVGGGLTVACTTDDAVEVPDGVTCSSTSKADDADAARSALAGAGAGSCVVLGSGSFAGPFTVPAKVTLTAAKGARATISGGSMKEASVTLGEGSGLAGVDVTGSTEIGVAVRGGAATLADVTVTGARGAAVGVRCTDCAGSVVLTNVSLTKSGLGLWVSGAHVVMNGGRSAEHGGESLSAAAGVIATGGAKLELDGVTIEKNAGVGVLIDGASTTAVLKSTTVSEAERGVWIQRVAGTLDAPAVRIVDSQLVKNRIIGVGAVESRGIIIVGGRVAETVLAPAQTNLQTNEQVGDGVGIFAGSTDFRIDGSAIEQNGRAAGLIDDAAKAGIIIVGGRIAAGTSGLKFVVQNTDAAAVQVSASDQSTPSQALGVSAPKLGVPGVL